MRIPRHGGPSILKLLRGRSHVAAVVAGGGALGTLARWSIAQLMPHDSTDFPWSTWLVNITGALLMGALMILVLTGWVPGRYARPFVGVGLLGGYTTFSTYMLDTRDLTAEGRTATAAAYLLSTLVVGLISVYVGMLVTRIALRALSGRERGSSGAETRSA